MPRYLLVLATILLTATTASAACLNRFLNKSDGPRHLVTLLTGKLTYQEAQALAEAIKSGQAPPIEWVTVSGKLIAKQFGDLKVIRPMPVACDGKSSGVVMLATFVTAQRPIRKMNIKLDPATTVAFDEQVR